MAASEYTNLELEQMAEALQPLLDLADIVGYTAALNMRLITDAIAEYVGVKERLLRQYGHESDGGVYAISQGDEGFDEFWGKFSEVAEVRHEVEFHKLPAERCVGVLTGRQFMDVWFMVEDGGPSDD